jgi:hypothetical protein
MELEQCFSPTQRLQTIWEEVHDVDPFLYAEVQLAVPAEEFLIFQWDWEDLWAFISADVRRKFLWLTDDTFLAVGDVSEIFDDDTPYNTLLIASSMTTSGQLQTLTLIKEMDADESTEACSIFWRAIETNKSDYIMIQGDDNYPSQLPSGPSLSQFLRGRPLLQSLTFRKFSFMEEHCRALATIQRTDLKITLGECALVPQNAQDIFIEWFRNNQIVTELNKCKMESSFFSALSGNNSLVKLSFAGTGRYGVGCINALTEALSTNQGIRDLDLCHCNLSVEESSLLFRSLWIHPRILFLSIWQTCGSDLTSSAQAKSTIMEAILQMLRHNKTVIKIFLPTGFIREEVYQNSILPRLYMNRCEFEVQRQAVKRADPSIRPQLLGRALYVVQHNANLVYRFLSENVPAFVRTKEEEEGNEEKEEDPNILLENDPNAVSVSGQKRKSSS